MSITDFFTGDFSATPTNVPAVVLGLLLAFLSGHLIAWVYMMTHSGLSYSRTFVNSLVVIPIVVALVMMVLSNNLVTAFGLMAVFAIVRFRNILRDTLDTTYILAVIVVGMACGTMKFATAVLGCALIAAVMFYLRATSFGTRHRYDYVLNLQWTRSQAELGELRQLLRRHALKIITASERAHEPHSLFLSYRVLLRDPGRVEEMLSELKALNGISAVNSLPAQDESEI
jgi:hypothetical protein